MACSAADIAQLVFGRGLRDEIVDARLRGDRGSGHRIVAGDHHRLDPHAAQRGEAVLDVGLHHVLEVNDAEDAVAVDEAQWRAAGSRDAVHGGAKGRRLGNIVPARSRANLRTEVDRSLAQLALADVDAGQPCCRRELDQPRASRRY